MKRSVLTFISICSFLTLQAQSKKEQIASLTSSFDSLKVVLENERNNMNNLTQKHKSEVESLNSEINKTNQLLIKKNNEFSLKQNEADSLRNIISKLKTELTNKTTELENIKNATNYLITNNSVGQFKINDPWRNIANNVYKFKFSESSAGGEGCYYPAYNLGKNVNENDNVEISISSTLFESNEDPNIYKTNNSLVFSESNCSGWYWNDKIGHITLYSNAFKTKEGIGVGSVLEDFVKKYNNYQIELIPEYAEFFIKTPSYPNLYFYIERGSLKDGIEEVTDINSFVKNTKISRIFIAE
jgi:hypothetical protein